MILLLLEYFFLAIFFITLVYFSYRQNRKKNIIAVEKLRHLCKTEMEVKMYDELQKRGIYVSPEVKCGFCTIPLALEPYKVAIFTYPNRNFFRWLRLKQIELYLRGFGWSVLKIPQENIQNDLEAVLQGLFNKGKIKNF